jgi:hypothetical protein
MHQRKQHRLQTHPPGTTQAKPGRAGYSNIQSPLHLHPGRCRQQIPLSLWCHLLKPTELTLNLLCQSRVAPKILAFAHIHGTYNYMQKPFALIGSAAQTHIKPDNRLSWDTRSEPGFNLGTSMEHPQCSRVYVMRTRATRISDTVLFKQEYIASPTISPESHVVTAAQQLVTALQGNIPASNETVEALTRVSESITKIAFTKKEVAKAKE